MSHPTVYLATLWISTTKKRWNARNNRTRCVNVDAHIKENNRYNFIHRAPTNRSLPRALPYIYLKSKFVQHPIAQNSKFSKLRCNPQSMSRTLPNAFIQKHARQLFRYLIYDRQCNHSIYIDAHHLFSFIEFCFSISRHLEVDVHLLTSPPTVAFA